MHSDNAPPSKKPGSSPAKNRASYVSALHPPLRFILQIGQRRRGEQFGGKFHRILIEIEPRVMMGKIAIALPIARSDKAESAGNLSEIISEVLRSHHRLKLPDPVVADDPPSDTGHPMGFDGIIDQRGISPLIGHPARGPVEGTGFLGDFPDSLMQLPAKDRIEGANRPCQCTSLGNHIETLAALDGAHGNDTRLEGVDLTADQGLQMD